MNERYGCQAHPAVGVFPFSAGGIRAPQPHTDAARAADKGTSLRESRTLAVDGAAATVRRIERVPDDGAQAARVALVEDVHVAQGPTTSGRRTSAIRPTVAP